jgi:hypothetical protein
MDKTDKTSNSTANCELELGCAASALRMRHFLALQDDEM